MSKEMILSSSTRPTPGVAAVLSFFIPGLGQFYNGAFLRGIFWLIAALVLHSLWIFGVGFLGLICHVVSAYTAYQYARELR
jgi:TM2 domain-containing membrane protein YozV